MAPVYFGLPDPEEGAISATTDDIEYVRELIGRILEECPRRKPASADERRAGEILAEELRKRGLEPSFEPFLFNDNLYANVALHFGLGALGTAISGVAPAAALICHLASGLSYWADSTRKGYYLRRLFPWRESRNVVAVMPAEGEPQLRIVLDAHLDAGQTGLFFNPTFLKLSQSAPQGAAAFKRVFSLATRTQFALAGFDLARIALGPLAAPLRVAEQVVNLPGLLVFLGSLELTLRDHVVPGANDNLSAVAALPLLVSRLAERKPREVEIVFLATGCEEASLGGADALARSREGVWDKSRTVVIGLEGLGNGDLAYVEAEGEVVRREIPDWLARVLRRAAKSEERFEGLVPFEIPVGGTDVGAFLARGWDGVCLIGIDPELHSMGHYHLPTDNLENLDVEQLVTMVDFTAKVVLEVIEDRLHVSAPGDGA